MMMSTLMSYRSLCPIHHIIPYIISYIKSSRNKGLWVCHQKRDFDIKRADLWEMALFTFLCFVHNHLDMYLWVSKQMHLSSSESRLLCAQMQNCSCGLNSLTHQMAQTLPQWQPHKFPTPTSFEFYPSVLSICPTVDLSSTLLDLFLCILHAFYLIAFQNILRSEQCCKLSFLLFTFFVETVALIKT